MPAYQTFAVPVAGGTVRGGIWGAGGPVLLCSHGITGNHTTFEALADQLGDGVRLIAVDHRGRGRSEVSGPWGMQAHAQDLVAVLDHLKLPRADILIGQSMGGFVAAVTGAEHGARVGKVLMVDGGIPLVEKLPWYMPVRLFLRLAIGPAMKRLDMSFASRDAYRDYWRAHPALAADWSAYVEHYLDYDLVGEPPAMRSSASKAAIVGDTRSMLDGLLPRSLQALRVPVRFLRAPRGVMNGKPLYGDAQLQSWGGRIASFSSTTVPDVNHYTILMSERGARAVADEVRRLLQ